MTAVKAIDEPPAALVEVPVGFAVGVEPAREVVRVKPVGELDLATVPELGDQVRELREVGFEQLIVDLRGLSFIDGFGVRLLLGLAQRARWEGWRLSLIQGSDPVRRVFALTGTLDRLPFSPFAADGEVQIKRGYDDGARRVRRDRFPASGDRAGTSPRAGVGRP